MGFAHGGQDTNHNEMYAHLSGRFTAYIQVVPKFSMHFTESRGGKVLRTGI